MGATARDRIYVFVGENDMPARYLPASPLIRNYLGHERRRPDSSIVEFLTRLRLNALAKDPNYRGNRRSCDEMDTIRHQLTSSLDTASYPFRSDTDGHVKHKGMALYHFALPLTSFMLEGFGSFYEVVREFEINPEAYAVFQERYFGIPRSERVSRSRTRRIWEEDLDTNDDDDDEDNNIVDNDSVGYDEEYTNDQEQDETPVTTSQVNTPAHDYSESLTESYNNLREYLSLNTRRMRGVNRITRQPNSGSGLISAGQAIDFPVQNGIAFTDYVELIEQDWDNNNPFERALSDEGSTVETNSSDETELVSTQNVSDSESSPTPRILVIDEIGEMTRGRSPYLRSFMNSANIIQNIHDFNEDGFLEGRVINLRNETGHLNPFATHDENREMIVGSSREVQYANSSEQEEPKEVHSGPSMEIIREMARQEQESSVVFSINRSNQDISDGNDEF